MRWGPEPKRVIDAQERYHTAKTRRPEADAAWKPVGFVLLVIVGILITHGRVPDWVVPVVATFAALAWFWLRRD